MNKYIKRARQMRSQLNGITADFTDAQALANKELYPNWNGNGVYLAAGAVVYYAEKLYRVIQPHTTQPDWTPDVAVSLFAEVLIPDPEVIPDWVQPDSTNAYMKGDKVRHKEKTWVSDVDNNVWEPSVYGWSEV